MKSHAQVVVIGGGVVGCSVLYHLTKFGWSDIVLLERSELTSGSTWHAAGGFHTLNADTNMAALQGYTINLYKELEQISGQNCGLHHVGGLTLATTPERMDFLKAERAKHRYMGLDTEIVGPDEIARLSPITNTDGVIGALYDPLDGHLDPYGTTHAYAAAAKMNGAQIALRTKVEALNPRSDGGWEVITDQGTIIAEHVVNAAGLWAREVGEMAGAYLPLHPMEHQYLVTDEIEQIVNRSNELPHVMDPTGESYLRQEGNGLVIGFYEQACVPWAVDGTDWNFGHELLSDDLDRIGDSLAIAYHRFPVLEMAGLKRVINGPFTFAPDGNPLVGPVPGLTNYWSACAVMAGFSQGGGVGLTLAQWMVEGQPSRDVFAMDVARFGDYCTKDYTRIKVTENYQRRFAVSYPNEELPAGRPLHTTPAFDIWKKQNAVFGQGYGLEHVNYFAPKDEEAFEIPSFRRSNAFDIIGRECMAVRQSVGLNEIHNFSKFVISGDNAHEWLDKIMAGRIPKPGRIALSPMLNESGYLIGDFTIMNLGDGEYQLTASYSAQAFHQRWFEQHIQSGVDIKNVSLDKIGFQIAGPKSRELLSAVTDSDVSHEHFKFLDVKSIKVGGLDAMVARVSYTGDLGYEIYVNANQQTALHEVLAAAGQGLGLRPFGMRAMMSLRLEKSFGSWMNEYKPDYTAAETGLDQFIDFNKAVNFIGKDVAVSEKKNPPERGLCTLIVEADDADVCGYEPVWKNQQVIGFVTSGGYAHYSKKSVAFALIPRHLISNDAGFEIEILGELKNARIFTETLFDPTSQRMRS